MIKELCKKAALDREHDMGRIMREQSKRIDEYEEKQRTMKEYMDASRNTSERAREAAESNVNRLEAERFQQLDEILSLLLALEEMQAQVPAQNMVNVPPPPPQKSHNHQARMREISSCML